MKAIILGATGAVGTELTRSLITSSRIQRITLVLRRPHADAAISNSAKVNQVLADVLEPNTYKMHLPGHDLAFSTFGVGQPSLISKEDFVRIDSDAVRAFARACKEAGAKHFSSLGAVGADAKSNIFYLRIKGKLEQALIELKFERVSLFRPSNIITPKNRYGVGQAIVLKVAPLMNPLLLGPLKQFRSIPVESLGQAMAANALAPTTKSVEFLTWEDFQRGLRG